MGKSNSGTEAPECVAGKVSVGHVNLVCLFSLAFFGRLLCSHLRMPKSIYSEIYFKTGCQSLDMCSDVPCVSL